MNRLRNALAEVVLRLSDWGRDRAERFTDKMEDLADWLYVPEGDEEQAEQESPRE